MLAETPKKGGGGSNTCSGTPRSPCLSVLPFIFLYSRGEHLQALNRLNHDEVLSSAHSDKVIITGFPFEEDNWQREPLGSEEQSHRVHPGGMEVSILQMWKLNDHDEHEERYRYSGKHMGRERGGEVGGVTLGNIR